MTSAVWERTPALGLGLIEFNFPNWADDANLNMKIIDGAMQALGMSIKGGWDNSTTYNVGDLVIDSDTGYMWRAMVTHTSSTTNTFAQERAANPTFWSDASVALHARGQWTPSTTYYPNDVVYNGYTWALVTQQYTSSSSFNQDVADANLVIIVDNESAVEDAEAAATVAMNNASTSTTAANTAVASATNANAAATAASGSEAEAAQSKTDAAASAAAAAASAAQADYLYSHMLPDAPLDSKYYGRQNELWKKVTEEAPLDATTYGRKNGAWVAASAMIVQDVAPSPPLFQGQLWFESDTGNTYMWYDDGNSAQWIHVSGFSAYSMGAGGGIAEAPTDSQMYARRNTGWYAISESGGMPEAPIDGKSYVRKDGTWIELTYPAPVATPFMFDVNGDAIIKFGSSIVVRIKSTGLILTKDDVEVFSTAV